MATIVFETPDGRKQGTTSNVSSDDPNHWFVVEREDSETVLVPRERVYHIEPDENDEPSTGVAFG